MQLSMMVLTLRRRGVVVRVLVRHGLSWVDESGGWRRKESRWYERSKEVGTGFPERRTRGRSFDSMSR